MLGTIKKRIMDKGFGFITPEEGGEDLFFHFSAIEGGIKAFENVEDGTKVQFDVIDGRKPGSKQANNIKLVSEEA